jgi:hypothetical protein
VFRPPGVIVLEQAREPTVVDVRYRLEAYATLRRRDFELGYGEARLQEDFNTSSGSPSYVRRSEVVDDNDAVSGQ